MTPERCETLPHPQWGRLTVVHDRPNAVYHADPDTLCATALKRLARSPAHYYSYLHRPAEPTTPACRKGQAFHAGLEQALSGRPVFDRAFVREPNVDKRTTGGKAVWAAFQDAHPGAVSLDDKTWFDVHGMVDQVLATPSVRDLLTAPAWYETSVYWQEDDLAMRCRPDWWSAELDLLIDYKSTQDARDSRFRWTVRDYGYDLAAAHYLSGIPVQNYGWLVVEAEPPYACLLYLVTRRDLVAATAQRQALLNQLRACQAEGNWPGYDLEGAVRHFNLATVH